MSSVLQRPVSGEIVPDAPPRVRRGGVPVLGAEVAVLALIATAVRAVLLDRPVFIDELNHVLAARSLLAEGTLDITEGGSAYERAWAFTYLVAGMFRVFGESLVVARVPAMLAGVGTVVLLFLWLRSVAGRGAAWIAALLLALSPLGIYLSQLVRFYSLHALLFLAGAVTVYALLTARDTTAPRIAALGVLAAALFGLSFHLQATTLIGLCGVAVAGVLVGGPRMYRYWASSRYRSLWLIGAVAAGLLIVLWLPISEYMRVFHTADYWAEAQRYNTRFYHRYFLEAYPTLWTLLPLLGLLAIIRYPKPAVYCAAIFGVAIIVHSLAAWKSQRFILYTLPFLFALVGMGSAEVIRWIFGNLRGFLAAANLPLRQSAISVVALAVLAIALAFAARANHAIVVSERMVLRKDADFPYALPLWSAAAPILRELAQHAEVVLASDELKALYFVGRIDYDIVPEYLGQLRGSQSDPVSHKTNTPWVITPEAFRMAMACHRSGLVVTEDWQWDVPRPPAGLPVDLSEAILELTDPIHLPAQWRLRAFQWRNPEAGWSADCARITELSPIPSPPAGPG